MLLVKKKHFFFVFVWMCLVFVKLHFLPEVSPSSFFLKFPTEVIFDFLESARRTLLKRRRDRSVRAFKNAITVYIKRMSVNKIAIVAMSPFLTRFHKSNS